MPGPCAESDLVLSNQMCVFFHDGTNHSATDLEQVIQIAVEEFLWHYPIASPDDVYERLSSNPVQIHFYPDMDLAGSTDGETVYVESRPCVASTALAHEFQHLLAKRYLFPHGHDNPDLFTGAESTYYDKWLSAENLANFRACAMCPSKEIIEDDGFTHVVNTCEWMVIQYYYCRYDQSCPDGFQESWADGVNKYGH